MNALLRLWAWYLEHPEELILHFAALLAGLWILGAVIFAIWQAHEERKQRAEVEKFERILQASTPKPPRAPGFNSRRVS